MIIAEVEEEINMLKKIGCLVLLLIAVIGVVGCSPKKNNPNVIVVGTIAGPETKLMEVAKVVAMNRYRLDVQIVPFSDYNAPNLALASGALDANAFQHKPFLDEQIKMRHFKLVAIGNTFVYPMGIYSHKITSLKQLKNGDTVALPNDPSNEARALLLLQQAGLIKIKNSADVNATPIDVINNPLQLKFVELDAAELPRALNSVTLAAINTNYAGAAKLSVSKDALIHEFAGSPYMNLIVVDASRQHEQKLLELVKAYQSQPVLNEAKKLFGDAAIPGWKVIQ